MSGSIVGLVDNGTAGPVDIFLLFDPLAFAADAVIAGGIDLQSDAGLVTAVILSLMLDRLALPDDVIPDGSTNRRGWCGDDPSPTADKIGSRLWLLARVVATPQTALQAQDYIEEALQWMLDDGVASQISVATRWSEIGRLEIRLQINRGTGTSATFDLYWSATL